MIYSLIFELIDLYLIRCFIKQTTFTIGKRVTSNENVKTIVVNIKHQNRMYIVCLFLTFRKSIVPKEII